MSLSHEQVAGVMATMDAYASAYKRRDIRAMAAVFSPDICGFGSGPDEVIRDHAGFIRQIRRDMGQAVVNNVEFTETRINGDGRVAWVMTNTTMTYTVPGSDTETLQGRSTMVMKNTGSRWRIEQIHFSMPYGGQNEGQSFPGA